MSTRPRRHPQGAFILTSDGKRRRWAVSGPHFGGWEIYANERFATGEIGRICLAADVR